MGTEGDGKGASFSARSFCWCCPIVIKCSETRVPPPADVAYSPSLVKGLRCPDGTLFMIMKKGQSDRRNNLDIRFGL